MMWLTFLRKYAQKWQIISAHDNKKNAINNHLSLSKQWFILTSKNLQCVFSDRIGTKFKLNDTNLFVHSTSNASSFSRNGGISLFSTLSFFVRLSIFGRCCSQIRWLLLIKSRRMQFIYWFELNWSLWNHD